MEKVEIYDWETKSPLEILADLFSRGELYVKTDDIKHLMRVLSVEKARHKNRNRSLYIYSQRISAKEKIYKIYVKIVFRQVLPVNKVV